MAVQAVILPQFLPAGSRQDDKKENRAIKKHGSLFFYLNYTNYQKVLIIIYYFSGVKFHIYEY